MKNGLGYLVDSGKISETQAGYIGLAINILLLIMLANLLLWGWDYNAQVTKHHCAAVCYAVDNTNGLMYYPDCDATGELDNTTFDPFPGG